MKIDPRRDPSLHYFYVATASASVLSYDHNLINFHNYIVKCKTPFMPILHFKEWYRENIYAALLVILNQRELTNEEVQYLFASRNNDQFFSSRIPIVDLTKIES